MTEALKNTHVNVSVIACDGADDVLPPEMGHPRVYMNVSKGDVVCPYCGRVCGKRDDCAKNAALKPPNKQGI